MKIGDNSKWEQDIYRKKYYRGTLANDMTLDFCVKYFCVKERFVIAVVKSKRRTLKGTAICNISDDFDLSEGQRIAFLDAISQR